MIKKILGVLALVASFSTYADIDLNKYAENFDDLNIEEKLSLKKELSTDKWIEAANDRSFIFQMNFRNVRPLSKKTVEVWIKAIAIIDTQKMKKNNYSTSLYHFNCEELTYKLLEGHIYDPNTGSIISSHTFSSSSQIIEKVIPDTTSDFLLQRACFYNKVKSISNLQQNPPTKPYKPHTLAL